MAVRFDAKRQTWTFVIDVAPGPDGRRRQMFRRGFNTEALAAREEKLAKDQFARTDPAAHVTVAAGLMQWLAERELDLAVTTLSNYRNAITK